MMTQAIFPVSYATESQQQLLLDNSLRSACVNDLDLQNLQLCTYRRQIITLNSLNRDIDNYNANLRALVLMNLIKLVWTTGNISQ